MRFVFNTYNPKTYPSSQAIANSMSRNELSHAAQSADIWPRPSICTGKLNVNEFCMRRWDAG